MKFSLSWLKEHLDTDADIHAVADCLNRIGLEVEGIENPADALSAFRIAKVLSAAPHPQADKLQVLSVDAGGEPLQVVCGAPNARAGMLGVFGPAGAVVPANGMVLKVAEIRGVESNGMMCSIAELELGDDHDGIIELSEDAPVGQVYADWAGLDDPVIDVSITPNRQDCMGVRGIARDLAAAGLGTLRPLGEVYKIDLSVPLEGSDAAPVVRTDDAAGCPAFYAQSVSCVRNGDSPEWMRSKLKAIGQKPISLLVDITNFVSIDLGRPLHVYDRDKLNGALVARKAVDGEQMVALNGKTYALDASMTVIADDAMVHDIGGIMGGEHSGVSEGTTDVLIECAFFDPEHIARTGQKLALTSDARQRFERGVDPAFLDDGLAIATKLVLDHAGGTASAIARSGQAPVAPRNISYDTDYCRRLGGIDVPQDEQRHILERLGFSVTSDWSVGVPSWRRDVDGPADIVEEVVRMVGLDNVVSVPLPRAAGVASPTATPAQSLERKVRRAAAARGLNEAINWSFLPQKAADAFGGGDWSLANPISEDMKVMRPSLLPGLLSAAQRNMDRGASSVRLFEIGRRYFAGTDGASNERVTAGIVLAGERSARNWASGKAARFDAFDAKAEAIALLKAAGVATDNLLVMDDAGAHYHPGQSATLRMGPKNILAAFGTLHPATAKAFDLDGNVVAAEIFLDAIPLKKAAGFMRPAFTPPALQAVTRDFAFLVAVDTPANDLIRSIKGCDKDNIVAVRLFDRFGGQGVPEGQVSLAVEVTLQPSDKSYSDDDLKAISDKVIAAATKLGAILRG
ncbi:MAG: phenylalanine--tRNA ligase subunit beta [Sphingorhabdus sp.]|jgi:phenylalanyl-tRNA synthetase beta chain|uniref:phenylalanine--tRNA ligase subunit beta n=1 Tax=Sphingorhabdus sp. TaxID=1902408 RepID=UPI00273DA4B3|nr:phenylalanine--tRNA ligase subunit beta [Sphingorhabdus sp.]MDP4758096.1 phenylalanine--tRNA ligase subunit beta [Sphingorhabdus sp.]MDP4927516.1 phenylalanine--tRNA ligase subunit beta [Sphingorhabdus sp.]